MALTLAYRVISGGRKIAFARINGLQRCSYSNSKSSFTYTQGQYNQDDPTVREYFYYIDHNGMLFLDDARMKNFTSCFKEKKFLKFFFARIRRTTTTSQPLHCNFPFTSYCGRERNYIRVNATPFVFTSLIEKDGSLAFEYNNTGNGHAFNLSSLYIASNGRLYHEFTLHKCVNFALVKSSIGDELSLQFLYGGKKKKGDEVDPQADPIAFIQNNREIIKLSYHLREDVEEALLGS